MKSLLSIVYLTFFFGCFLGKAQSINVQAVVTPGAYLPSNSQLEIRGNKLITQNFYNIPSSTQTTGTFGNTSRWNSMGSLSTPGATGQTLNGFRSQTDGRGLTMGFSVPNAGTVSNPFIEWIGNNPNFPSETPTNPPAVLPGNLEFRYAQSPTGAAAARIPIFTMASAKSGVPSFNYAETDAFIGQLQSGTFGGFSTGDTWSATGATSQNITPSVTTYGTRHQYEGSTLISGFIKSSNRINAVMDFGNATNQFTNTIFQGFKFRVFTDPTQPNSVRNIWQSDFNSGNIMMGRQDISTTDASKYFLSVYDGANLTVGNAVVDRAGIYAISNATDEAGNQINNYAAIVGDLKTAPINVLRKYAILGIASDNGFKNNWAGYFIGNVGTTGSYVQVSDKRFKTNIDLETNILEKLMQLQPKH